MNDRRILFAVVVALSAVSVLYFLPGAAHAYALQDGASTSMPSLSSTSFVDSWNSVLDNISPPFGNFVQSLQSVNSQDFSISNIPSLPSTSSDVPGAIHNAFEAFDAWLYGILGFHISTFVNDFLGVTAWVLGLAKSVVDWMSSVLKG